MLKVLPHGAFTCNIFIYEAESNIWGWRVRWKMVFVFNLEIHVYKNMDFLNRALASLEPSGLEMGREGEVESGSKA